MRYFYDTEFIDNGRIIDLISIGVVADDGREFYAVSTEFDPESAGRWAHPCAAQAAVAGVEGVAVAPGDPRGSGGLSASTVTNRSNCGPGWALRPRRALPAVGSDDQPAAADSRFTRELRQLWRTTAARGCRRGLRTPTTRWWTRGTTAPRFHLMTTGHDWRRRAGIR